MAANPFDIPTRAKKDSTRKLHADIVKEYRRLIRGHVETGAAIDRIARERSWSFRTIYRILAEAKMLQNE